MSVTRSWLWVWLGWDICVAMGWAVGVAKGRHRCGWGRDMGVARGGLWLRLDVGMTKGGRGCG